VALIAFDVSGCHLVQVVGDDQPAILTLDQQSRLGIKLANID
jgi:hypothetical protein